MSAWCVVAYRYTGGLEIHGPYELRGEAATAAIVIAAADEYEAAYTLPMTEPGGNR